MKKLAEIVKKAAGYSEERQDQVEVINVPFESNAVLDEEADSPEQAPGKLAQWAPFVRYGVGLALAFIVLLFVFRPILKALSTPTASQLPSPAYLPSSQRPAGGEMQIEAPGRAQMLQLAKQNP